MFAKRPAPVIGKLPINSFISGGIWDATSPRSPLECKILSPRGPINCDLSGVGLGIVAAMEKYSDPKSQVLPANKSSCHRNTSRSDPVPVNPPPKILIITSKKGDTEEKKQGSLEDYTFVTGCGPDNKRFTRVYYDGSDQIQRKKLEYSDCRRRRSKWNQTSLFTVSTPRFGDFPSCPADDFLSNCHMCQKKLHGKDIYMYRGEKGYCSPECRQKQIVMDEKKEKICKSTETTSRSVEVSSSTCQNGRIFFSPEIVAV